MFILYEISSITNAAWKLFLKSLQASLKHPKMLSPQVSEMENNDDVSWLIYEPLTIGVLIAFCFCFCLQSNGNGTISVEDSLKKRMFALKELVSTEDSYVQDLALIVNG